MVQRSCLGAIVSLAAAQRGGIENAHSRTDDKDFEQVTLGSGCFWCTEAVFQQLKGVKSAVSGYSGGHIGESDLRASLRRQHRPRRSDPGHVRPVADLVHRHACASSGRRTIRRRPTGRATTSARSIARRSSITTTRSASWPRNTRSSSTPRARSARRSSRRSRTFEKFYPAEKYHQEYFEQNPGQQYCEYVIRPKVEKFRKEFADLLDDAK